MAPQVLPHGPLVSLAGGVWTVDGAVPDMPIPRRMTVVRRADGSLLVHSAIQLDPATQAELDALGPVSLIVVPNAWHRIDAPAYAARYPDARVVAPAGARAKVARVVRVDGDYDTVGDDGRVSFTHWRGTRDAEGVLWVRADADADGATAPDLARVVMSHGAPLGPEAPEVLAALAERL